MLGCILLTIRYAGTAYHSLNAFRFKYSTIGEIEKRFSCLFTCKETDIRRF